VGREDGKYRGRVQYGFLNTSAGVIHIYIIPFSVLRASIAAIRQDSGGGVDGDGRKIRIYSNVFVAQGRHLYVEVCF